MKRLERIGDGVGIIIEAELVEQLKLTPNDSYECEVQDGKLVVSFVSFKGRVGSIMSEFDETFRKLAE